MFECEHKILYGIENQNNMMHIHDKERNKIAECNLLHIIINPPKLTKNLNSHYSHILHECMNTIEGKGKFKKFSSYLKVGVVPRLHWEG